uniref:trypsin n=1 Tax=Cyprinus carpio TaxID=7962 RepID=A0A8C2KDJ8_CYPCA
IFVNAGLCMSTWRECHFNMFTITKECLLVKRQCEQRYSDQFTSRMLCAGSSHDDHRVDSCRGDSGGPLVCERSSGSWVVYGVTSWGHACRLQDAPGVYTKVSAFVPWIKKLIGK